MAIVNRSFSVNVTPGMMPPIVHVSEYDVGRAYTVSILDEQGNTFTIPSGTSASIEGTLNGSVGFTQSATVSNNRVSFTLSESMTAYSGKAWCKIKLTQNSQPIQTCAFILAVDRAGVEAETVIGAPGFEEQIRDATEDWLEEQGFQSPTVSITPITGGNRVTFTDAEHPQGQSIDVLNGADGEDGETTNIDATLTLEDYAADAKATGEAIAAAKTAAKNETISAITEPASDGSSNSNIIDPSNIKKLGYYYDNSDGVTQVADTNNQWLVSENKIPLGDTDIVVYAMTRVVVSTLRGYEILCYQDDNYLGKVNNNFMLGSTNVTLIQLKPYTNAIRVQCNTYGDAINPADLCICLDKFDTFVEYGGGSGDAVIKESLIDSASVLSEIAEKVMDSSNLVDPKNFRAWGYYWNSNGQGAWSGPATYQWQSTKEKIAVGSAIDLYARIRNPVDSNLYSVTVLCYNGDSYLGDAGLIQINTTDEQHFTLKQGTDRIALTLNIYETTFESKDICVSLVSLDEFEEYSYSLKIKPSAIPSDSDIALSVSKRSSLYRKNVIFFGDSIIGDGTIPFYVGQMTGAKVYNAGVGGTSMSDRGGTSIYTKWYTMVNLADCIASGDWADTFAGINASSENNKEAALKRAQYLSQLNWNTDVDMIVIMYGANDLNTDNANDRLDVTTYAGAARHVIETLLTAYPHLRIVFCTVIYKTGGENGGTVGKRDKLISVCQEYNIQCIDNYSTLGINALTESTYLADGLHPSASGMVLMYNHIAQELW